MARPRILLVDDDRRVRQLVGLTLPVDDFELSFAEDGADAIRAAQRLQPDLILLACTAWMSARRSAPILQPRIPRSSC
jgi:CheY-like chemotaxis protein